MALYALQRTDEDCGGPCSALGFGCAANQKCSADADCKGDIKCIDGKCGLDGKTKESAGLTCKSIRINNKDSANGFYWVTGPHGEFTAENGLGPKKVMCWMEVSFINCSYLGLYFVFVFRTPTCESLRLIF